MIEMNSTEGSACAVLVLYPNIPLSIKLRWIKKFRPEHRPIGQILAGLEPNFITPDIQQAVEKMKKWRECVSTETKRKNKNRKK